MKPVSVPVLTLLAALVAAPLARADLNFTLRHKAMVNDAISVDNPYITDGASKIFLQLPNLWTVIDGEAGLDFVPNAANSKVRIESVKSTPPLNVDETGGRALLGQVTGQVPDGAKQIVALAAELNPMPLFGWQTLEATVSYELVGEKMRRSIMYVKMLPGRIVALTVVARDADFDRVHTEARHILSSWFEPSRDLPPDLQKKYESPDMGGQ